MVLFALTGTPGTGKTTVSAELRSRGYEVIDGKAFITERGLLGEYDAERDTYEVDLDDLNDALEQFHGEGRTVILDSHLSHLMDSRGIIILRCAPGVLAERLRARDYSESKVLENVQAEILAVIESEALESDIPVGEVDCTSITVEEAADIVERIIRGDVSGCMPGNIDWLAEMDAWF